jgi:hypothetical protein
MFLFAGLEFGRYNMILQSTSNAAFDAARACIVPGAATSDGVTAGLKTLSASGIAGGAVTISPMTGTTVTATIDSTTTSITATVTVPVTRNLWTSAVFLKKPTVTKTCTLASDWVNSAH